MKNKYAGKCQRCGMTIAAGDGNLENRNGKWVIYHDGPCPDIESGLGIGGAGSDDFNIGGEYVPTKIIGSGKGFGAHGRRYDEECECCHEETVVCNWCGCCKKCCVC